MPTTTSAMWIWSISRPCCTEFPACVDELEATLEPLLDRKLTTWIPIERTLLRMGTLSWPSARTFPTKW